VFSVGKQQKPGKQFSKRWRAMDTLDNKFITKNIWKTKTNK